MPPRLSSREVRQFRRQGFLTFRRPVFAPRRFRALQKFLDQKMRGVPPEHCYETLDAPHLSSPETFEWLFAGEVLDLVQPILGPDIAVADSRFFCKLKGQDSYVGWHADTVLRSGVRSPVGVRVWLALDPARRDNGCVIVMPGSHRVHYQRPRAGKNVRYPIPRRLIALLKRSDGVPAELAPNQALIMDETLLHRSGPNHVSPRRAGFVMHFVSTKVRWRGAHVRPIYLARGRDRGGNRYADPAVPRRDKLFRAIASRLFVGHKERHIPDDAIRKLFSGRSPRSGGAG